ncbi:hypothetical protein Nepgr_003944 [Nepenthes gracilis]|uniref:Uncharacterized protein n=1 Tax=Nepenthes gracilis TaxID=150966 RepID=A0AAD3S0G9_NEPGR|nr:hypothetical protein Nepgr_003944 [Nepenthes gracilis]
MMLRFCFVVPEMSGCCRNGASSLFVKIDIGAAFPVFFWPSSQISAPVGVNAKVLSVPPSPGGILSPGLGSRMAIDLLNVLGSVQIQSSVESEIPRHNVDFTKLLSSHETISESLGSLSSTDFGVCNEPGDGNPTGCSEGIAVEKPCSDPLIGIDVSFEHHEVDAAGPVSSSLADEVVPSALGAGSDGVSQEVVVVSQMQSVLADISAGEVSEAGLQSSPNDGVPTGSFMEGSSVAICSDAITSVDIPTDLPVLFVADPCVDEHVAGSFPIPLAIFEVATIEDGSRGAYHPSMFVELASKQNPCHQVTNLSNQIVGSPGVAPSEENCLIPGVDDSTPESIMRIVRNDFGHGTDHALSNVDLDAGDVGSDSLSRAISTLIDDKVVQRCLDLQLPCCSQADYIPEGSSSGNVAARQGLAQCYPTASPKCHQGHPAPCYERHVVHSELPLERSCPAVAGGRPLEVLGAVALLLLNFGISSAALALILDWSSCPALGLAFDCVLLSCSADSLGNADADVQLILKVEALPD